MTERIAIVTSSYPSAPGDFAGHFVECEARELVRSGHDVTVFTAGRRERWVRAGEPTVVRFADGGASGAPGLLPRLRQQPLRAVGVARWLLTTRRALQREAPFSRVIAHFMLPVALPLLSGAALRSAELELVVHGSDLRMMSRWPAPLARAVLQCLRARNARFRCVSLELLRELERLAGHGLGEVAEVRPASIEVASAPGRDAARRRLGIAAEQRLVVVVGRLIASKRVHEALAAARLLSDVAVFVLGDGPERAALESQFPSVQFLGAVERPLALTYIAAADALLSASRWEGAPTAIREARALGVTVVASAAGDLPSLARDDAGLWVVAG